MRRLRATPSRWRIPSEYFFTAVPTERGQVDTLERSVDPPERLAADEAEPHTSRFRRPERYG